MGWQKEEIFFKFEIFLLFSLLGVHLLLPHPRPVAIHKCLLLSFCVYGNFYHDDGSRKKLKEMKEKLKGKNVFFLISLLFFPFF